MLKHLVMFKFKGSATRVEREDLLAQLETLKDHIDCIRDLQIGLDVLHTGRSWDGVLIVTLDDLQALQVYADHPFHVPIKQAVARLADVATVDFQYQDTPV